MHAWTFAGKGRWQCSSCLRTTATPDTVPIGCHRMPLRFHSVMREPKGHRVWAGQICGLECGTGLFIYCTSCACFGCPRSVRGLTKECLGAPHSATSFRHATNISERVHPTKGVFRRPWPLVPFNGPTASAAALPPESQVPIFAGVPDFGFDDDDADPMLPPVGAQCGDSD